jgi:hypothetical protein
MWQQTVKPVIFSYWQTLFHLYRGQAELSKRLDLPLKEATTRAWSTISWTVICTMAAMLTVKSSLLSEMVSYMGFWSVFVLPIALILTVFLSYGFFRLYVLVSHVLAINIFKSRGQRLRWLNLLTTILALSFPATLAIVVFYHTYWPGLIFGAAVGIYSLALGTWACKLVFHKTTWRGFGFLLGLNTVTTFILITCCIAALAAMFILGFFVLLIARIFYG